jgi:hypothetical protein
MLLRCESLEPPIRPQQRRVSCRVGRVVNFRREFPGKYPTISAPAGHPATTCPYRIEWVSPSNQMDRGDVRKAEEDGP